MPNKQGPQRPGPPNGWSDEKKHLFRKMIGNTPEELIQTIAKYKAHARGDPELCQLTPQQIKQAIGVAKYILTRFHKVTSTDADEIVDYYINTGKIIF